MKPTLTLNDLLLEQWLRKRQSGELVWTTRDGKEIPLKDMTDKHIENAIKCVSRNGEMRDAAAEFMSEDWGDRD